ncbi:MULTISPECIES: BMC domain-containing protein [Clostridia]|uniref:BMC domain-containing protein n=1 Tax=Clostridia TaxID=186801 RepID=UPI000EA16AB0|nr:MULTISPECIES: BMC domain-containing protein [Clostridia]NBJ68048.1 BMC domain-containing protein [Roseburia sp. 1XD42-34]RKI82489.1 BMC domain-containing protein [Clostridium sp. 1xD42-85]
MRDALGIIEVRGLVSSIEVSDAMLKAADVQLTKLNITRGIGWMMIAVNGKVGAVNAAIEAGEKVAAFKNSLVSSKVIPRPIDDIFQSADHGNELHKNVFNQKKASRTRKKVVNKTSDLEELAKGNKKQSKKTEEKEINDRKEETKSKSPQKATEANNDLNKTKPKSSKRVSATSKRTTTTKSNTRPQKNKSETIGGKENE